MSPLVALSGLFEHARYIKIGGEGGIRTHGTVTRTTVFEFYDSRAGVCRTVPNRAVLLAISLVTVLPCDVLCRLVSRSWPSVARALRACAKLIARLQMR